jgi:hemoglobin
MKRTAGDAKRPLLPRLRNTPDLQTVFQLPHEPGKKPDMTTDPSERRAALTAAIQAETGIDEAMIERLVRAFYRRVQDDAMLGPVFAARIKDWEPHLQQMFAFWSSVALMSGRYHGQPMRKHLPLPVDGRHFDRWLELFELTARETCPPKAAAHFLERARRIGESLELGIAGAHGQMLHPGERLVRPELDPA